MQSCALNKHLYTFWDKQPKEINIDTGNNIFQSIDMTDRQTLR